MDTIFQTSSLNLVAWLMVKGYDIKDNIKINGRTIFYFDRVDGLQNAINQYNQNEELKQFIAKFKYVKEIAKS